MQFIPDLFSDLDDITYSQHAENQMLDREVDEEEVREIFERSGGGRPGRQKDSLRVSGVTSHGRHITVIYTRHPTGPHVITVINHSKKRKGG